jgi:AAA+ superfamily predicted ATPase
VEILEEHIPPLAEAGPLVLLVDEVEALAASRSMTSLEANPVDIHRATNAVLSGLDRLASGSPKLLTVATTNFQKGVDAAFLSRADLLLQFPMPSPEVVCRILRDSLSALAAEYHELSKVATSADIERVAELLKGMDGRQVRKFIVDVLAHDLELALSPGLLTTQRLLSAARTVAKTVKEED